MNYPESVKTLKKMSQAYYNETPIATDSEFDALFKEVKAYEAANPSEIDPLSPTQTVGAMVADNFSKKKHIKQMYSLEDLFSVDEWLAWAGKLPEGTQFYLEPKYDGASLNLVYENGNLISAITRGDGKTGEDITVNAPHLLGLPLVIDHKGLIEVRGEVVILHEDFDAVNEWRVANGKSKFSNQRNAASGGLRSLESENVRAYKLRFIPYSLGENELDFDTQEEEAKWFVSQGFNTYGSNDYTLIGDAEFIAQAYKDMEANREGFRMLLDGAVVKVCDKHLQEELGSTSRFPKFALALKFVAMEKTAVLGSCELQVGKVGAISPVGVLREPVEIGGVQVSRVTLHNFPMISDMDLRVGDSISIIRSGDVIPKITAVFKERRDGTEEVILEPTVCPNCGDSHLDKSQTVIKCTNIHCSATIKGRIFYGCGRKALNMEALGESTIDEMVDRRMVFDLVDLFKLEYNELLTLNGFKEKKATKVYKAIQSAIGTEAERLLNAIDIPQIGQSASAKIIEHYGSRAFDIGEKALSHDELLQVQDIGEESAKFYVEFMAANCEYVQELVSIVKPVYAEKVELGSSLKGKTIVITGSLSRPRSEFKALAEAHGAKVVSGSVSKNTSLLLAGEKAGSKATKAESLGVTIINEEQFNELIA